MKITQKVSATKVHPVNRAAVKNASDKKLKDTPYFHLLLVIAEGLDEIANDTNFYCTFGSIKDSSSYTFSVTLDKARQTLYADDLSGLAVQAAELHDPL